MIGFILQVAVRAASRHTRRRTEVIALLIGGIGDVHRMAEFTAELFRASPVHDAREHADKDNADHDADQADAGEIPNAVLFHLRDLCLLLRLDATVV